MNKIYVNVTFCIKKSVLIEKISFSDHSCVWKKKNADILS